ncbi:MAG: hypothetical protein L3J28_11435 [Candidatus Polarisedimenticolaceae bacterium]|nr:hypothetical protein [Candidatus Polarisedimenticolaceae bacterium]
MATVILSDSGVGVIFKSKPKVRGNVGLAISADKISISRVVVDEGQKPHLEMVDCVICEDRNERQATLQALVEKHKLQHAPCTAVLGEGEYQLLQLETPDVDESEVRSAIRWQLGELVTFPVDEAVIDIFEIPGQKEGRRPFIYVVAAHAAPVKALTDLIDATDLSLQAIDISELVVGNFTSLLPEDDIGIAMLRISNLQSLVNLSLHSKLYFSRVFNVGTILLNQVNESLSRKDELDFEMSGQLDSFVLDIQRLLGYYESHFSLPPITNLILTPTSSELTATIDYISMHLGISTQSLDLNSLFEISSVRLGTCM